MDMLRSVFVKSKIASLAAKSRVEWFMHVIKDITIESRFMVAPKYKFRLKSMISILKCAHSMAIEVCTCYTGRKPQSESYTDV